MNSINPIGRQPSPLIQDPRRTEREDLGGLIRRPFRTGLIVILVFASAFVGWGSLAPLSGGAVARARITPDGGVRTVQHLEGGIIQELHVREGDHVTAGEALITLANVSASAEVALLMDRRMTRQAENARLEAELQNHTAITFPEDLIAQDTAADAAIAAERRVFETRREMIVTRKRILARRMDQLHEQITGFRAQGASTEEQIAIATEDLQDKQALFEKRLAPKSETLRLRRIVTELHGELGEQMAEIARIRQRIGETELELRAVDAERAAEIANRAGEVRLELAEINRSLSTRNDILARTTISSPYDGVVANLRSTTEGSVIGPGDLILDIVPAGDPLLVNAQIRPADIDLIGEGQTAIVTLTAYSGSVTPRIEGVVIFVSADTIRDDVTGQDFYTAQIKMPNDAILAQEIDIDLISGMTADVLIVAQERTLVEYLFEPFTEILRRGFREG